MPVFEAGVATRSVGAAETPPVLGVISMNAILLLTAPVPLVTVSRPSLTVTLAVPSMNRLPLVGVPLTTLVPSAS